MDTSRKRLLAESGCSWTDGLRENLGYFLQEAKLDSRIKEILQSLETEDLGNLRQRGRQIRQAILESTLPTSLEGYITEAYKQLSEGLAEPADVAVRSSATAEDLPDASFTGQQETYLNVQGPLALLEACKRCFASLFTDRAISYRTHKGFDHLKIALSIGVQRMVRSDLAASGVLFTIDTETGFQDVVLINASYGLGENIVQGSVNPDEYYVFKPTLKQGFRPILQKVLGSKEFKLIYDLGGSKMVKNVPVPPDDNREGFALECQAMRKVREEMGLTNVKLMIPFCRTVEEGRRVLAEMEKHGLRRGETGLEVYVMCEIPSNVILAVEYAEIFGR